VTKVFEARHVYVTGDDFSDPTIRIHASEVRMSDIVKIRDFLKNFRVDHRLYIVLILHSRVEFF